MATSRYSLGKLRAALLKPTNIPALVAVIVIIIAGVYADHQNNLVYRQNLRADVLAELSVVRAKLEGNVNGNLQLVRGLIAAISTEPDMNQARYEALASRIFAEQSQLRSVAVAPDLIITMTYPLAGNERAIGLDYRKNEAQREAAMRAMSTGKLVLAGPVELVQGGRGFVGRFPVYVDDAGSRRFWGLVSAVIDVDQLYEDSGLLDESLSIDVGITGKDSLGGTGNQFYESRPGIFEDEPVTADVLLPSGSWIIAAVPKAGWNVSPPNMWFLRAVVLLLGALVVFPILAGSRLMEERQRNLQALGIREAELRRLSRRR